MRPLKVLMVVESLAKALSYAAGLEAGGIPGESIQTITPESPKDDFVRLAAQADGLMLCGGPDVEPWRFGEQEIPDAHLSLMPELDAIEHDLLTGARQGRTPVWGVCRGLHVINVFLGGTLWQDLHMQLPGVTAHDLSYPRDALIHPVDVLAPDTRLGELLEREMQLVNSRHHQAVKRLAPGLKLVARAPDGVIEAAIGDEEDWWIHAVQWHPENLVTMRSQLALWQGATAAMEEHRDRHP